MSTSVPMIHAAAISAFNIRYSMFDVCGLLAFGVYTPVLAYLVILAAIAASAIAAAARQGTENSRRSSELKVLGERLAFTGFDAGPNEEFVMGWQFLDCLSKGENRYAFNILEGTYHDQKLFVFDYHFQTNSGKNVEHWYYTILMLIVPLAFPTLTIRPQNIFGRIEGTFDGEDIKFESAEFSKVYRVRCRDKKFAYDVCNPQMIEYLLSNRELEIEFQGPVIALRFSPQLPAPQIEFNLQRIAEIRALLPQYLFSKQ